MPEPTTPIRRSSWHWLRHQAVTAAIVGLAAAAAGSILQGKYSIDVEKRRAESELIVQALQANDQGEALKRLRFYKRLGLITIVDDATLDALTPAQLPVRTIDGDLSSVLPAFDEPKEGGTVFGKGALNAARRARETDERRSLSYEALNQTLGQ